jgi:putative hydrolase
MKKESYFQRFNSMDKKNVCADNHIHSKWSDGKDTIESIAGKACRIGLRQITFTEHVRANSTYFDSYADEIEKIRKKYPLIMLIGFEAKVKNLKGDLDVCESALLRSQVRMASVHRLPVGNQLYYPKQLDIADCQKYELELSLGALKKGICSVLGHPGGMSLRAYNEFPIDYFERIILECKKSSIAFELNSSYHSSIYRDLKILLKKHNPMVSIGSDVHSAAELGTCVDMVKNE